jgi:hypothetical protein
VASRHRRRTDSDEPRSDDVPAPLGLERLPSLIRKGKWVVGVLGPSVLWVRRKTVLVKSLLQQTSRLITDLVIDVVSAEQILVDP